jgi:hypothetical protein
MLLTVKDLDTAEDVVAHYLATQGTPDIVVGYFNARSTPRAGSSIRPKSSGGISHTAEIVITPSRKLFCITALWQEGHPEPDIVWLSFTEPSQESYASPDGAGVEHRYQEEATFHLLLPKGETPIPPDGKKELDCPVCRWKFRPLTPEQHFCCDICASGKGKYSRHAEQCSRIPRPKERRLRRILSDPTLKVHPDRQVNLVTSEEEKDGIFLQLAIYAERRGWLSPKAKDEAFRRFKRRFKQTVGRLSEKKLQEGSRQGVVDSILADAWERVKKGYCLPGIADGFSHYVRYVISRVKRPSFSQDPGYLDRERGEESNHEDGEESEELYTGGFRRCNKKWTNLRWSDRAEVEVSVREAAAKAEVSWRTLYDLIEKGKVPAEKRVGQLFLTLEGQRILQKWKEDQKRIERSKNLAEVYSEKREVSPDSAMRRIRRLREQGLGDREIAEKIARECGLLPDETEES